MKKKYISLISVILALVMVLIAGCGTKQPSTTSQSQANSAAASQSVPAEKKIDYPKGPITMIIPTSAGGGYDLGARLVARYLPKYLPNKINIVPENASGGGQMIGVHKLYASKPDGYTIGIYNNVGALLAQFIRPEEIKFDMAKFIYLGAWQTDIRAIGVSNKVTAKTWDELVALSKQSPLLCGTGGAGSGQHTDMQVIAALTDIKFKYVHYDGSAQVDPALGRNEIQIESAQTATIKSMSDQKLGRAFCVFSDKRDPAAPDVPTALEVGMPKDQYEKIMSLPFFGVTRTIAAPPGTDPAIVKILRDAIWKVFQDPEYIKELETMGGTNNPTKGEELNDSIQAKIKQVPNFPDVIKALKATN